MELIEISVEQFRRREYKAPPCPECGRTTVPGNTQRVQTFEDPAPLIAITSWRCTVCYGA